MNIIQTSLSTDRERGKASMEGDEEPGGRGRHSIMRIISHLSPKGLPYDRIFSRNSDSVKILWSKQHIELSSQTLRHETILLNAQMLIEKR